MPSASASTAKAISAPNRVPKRWAKSYCRSKSDDHDVVGKLVTLAVVATAALIRAAAAAGDVHPMLEIQSGYRGGATADGKWHKADETAKALSGGTSYQV